MSKITATSQLPCASVLTLCVHRLNGRDYTEFSTHADCSTLDYVTEVLQKYYYYDTNLDAEPHRLFSSSTYLWGDYTITATRRYQRNTYIATMRSNYVGL